MPTVGVSGHGPVTVVTIDRPERRQRGGPTTAAALLDAFMAFDEDDSGAVAVLTGSGGTFCAGADLKAARRGPAAPVAEDGPGPMGPTRLQLSKPVIAAVEGYAVAGGLELAIWCDLRVTGADAAFGVFCRRFGVPLIDGGTVRPAPPHRAGQGPSTSSHRRGEVEADEALAMGLVNRVAPAGCSRGGRGVGHHLAALPQTCMRNDRRSALAQWDSPRRTPWAPNCASVSTACRRRTPPPVPVGSRSGAGRHGSGVDLADD